MKISRTSAVAGASVIALALGAGLIAQGPARGQDSRNAPTSLLPPGFDAPSSAPAPAPAPRPADRPAAPSAPAAVPVVVPAPSPSAGATPLSPEEQAAADAARAADLLRYELPDFAKRPTNRIGVTMDGNPELPRTAFGRTDGRFLRTLMRRMRAPVASRWVSIALRRALLSHVDTPPNTDPVDFAAERAWLLLRMGEAQAARALVQNVDVEDYSPWMYQVAMQAALATGDPAALCPIADQGAALSSAPGWKLSRAMCAGLAGDGQRATALIRDAGGGRTSDSIDLMLARKVIGMGATNNGTVTIEWDDVDRLTPWRFGLAMASGETVPDRLLGAAPSAVRYWYALSPSPSPDKRIAAAELAAANGVFSSAGLLQLYAEAAASPDSGSAVQRSARVLANAFTDDDWKSRVDAMRTLWTEPRGPRRQYGRLILTARAAAAVQPSEALLADSDTILAAMLSTGYATRAQAWRPLLKRGSEGWAMAALADPAGRRMTDGDVSAYRAAVGDAKARLFYAGLAGLGLLSEADSERMARALEVQVGGVNSWTRAIDNAARARDPGLVVLLCATGMQTRSWDHVSPEALFHIVAGLRAVGLVDYARLVAVEAVTRT